MKKRLGFSCWSPLPSAMGVAMGMYGLLIPGVALGASPGTLIIRVEDSAGRPIDGSVMVKTTAGATVGRCRTIAGTGTIRVAAARYRVYLAPIRGTVRPVRHISVRAGITLNILLRAGPEPPSNTAPDSNPDTGSPPSSNSPPGKNLGKPTVPAFTL